MPEALREALLWANGYNNPKTIYHVPGSGSIYWQAASRKHSVIAPGRYQARGALDELSWSLLDATLQAAPAQVLARSAAIASQHLGEMSPVHQRLLAAIRRV